ncbi:hypothetical protein KR054_010216, partial [Drosophila jambulina]
KMGMGTGFSKCFILFMAIVILAQGIVYLGLSIWGITFRTCHDATNFVDNPFKFAMELIYFAEKECGTPALVVQGQDFQLSIDWNKSFTITNREYIFMITYAVVSGLWVATSVLIITTLCNRTTKLISGVVYWPWFLSVLAGCILDVVASVYHGLDLSHTTSLEDTLEYIGGSADTENNFWSLLEPFGVYFSTPAIVMLCLTTRVAIIWLLNLIGASFCLSLSGIMAQQNAAKTKAKVVSGSQAPTRQQTPQPAVVAAPQPVVMAEVETVVLPTAPPETQYPEQIRPKPLPIFIPVEQNLQRQNSQQYAPGDRTTLQSPVMVLPPQVPQQQRDVVSQQPDINTYRTTEAHPDRLNYPPSEPATPRSPSPAVQQLAVTSPLNNRYSEMYPAPANPRVSEELRNQMPWSYTSMITKPPPPPRKPQLQVQIYPQIPEPDYADH